MWGGLFSLLEGEMSKSNQAGTEAADDDQMTITMTEEQAPSGTAPMLSSLMEHTLAEARTPAKAALKLEPQA
ncbi:hypothetical protein ACA910_009410 [Epithemia clementina (nom. ined.)]